MAFAMKSTASKMPVGSAPWIINERREAAAMLTQESEDFAYTVRNEMEWLNAHMADIFAPGNLYVPCLCIYIGRTSNNSSLVI